MQSQQLQELAKISRVCLSSCEGFIVALSGLQGMRPGVRLGNPGVPPGGQAGHPGMPHPGPGAGPGPGAAHPTSQAGPSTPGMPPRYPGAAQGGAPTAPGTGRPVLIQVSRHVSALYHALDMDLFNSLPQEFSHCS